MTALPANEVFIVVSFHSRRTERRCVDGLCIRFHQLFRKIALSLQENRSGLAFWSQGVQCGPLAALRASGMRHRLRCQWPHGHVERPRAAP